LDTLGTRDFVVGNHEVRLVGWCFGAGYQNSIRADARVTFCGRRIDVKELAAGRRRTEAHHALFVPAHRALVMGTGWPRTSRSFSEATPFVVRDFSARLISRPELCHPCPF
jgi:hypothetical protein